MYRAARKVLHDELRLEPSDELKELQRAILAQSDELRPTPASRSRLPLARERMVGRERELAETKGLLAATAAHLGLHALAATLFDDAIAVFAARNGDGWRTAGTVSARLDLGHAALFQGDSAAAVRAYRASVAAHLELDANPGALAEALTGLASAASQQGGHHRAACLAGAAATLYGGLEEVPWPPLAAHAAARLAQTKNELGNTAFQAAWDEGAALEHEQAVALAFEEVGSPAR